MKQYKYAIKGTIIGSRSYEDYTEDVDSKELAEYEEEIRSLFPTDENGNLYPDDELSQYIHESGERDGLLYGVVTEIWVNVKNIDGKLYSWTEVTANRELNEIEKEALLDYLTGQFSDGYGEGLEQQEFNSYTDTDVSEEWDEEEQETYMEEYEVRVDMYLHLWQSKNFHLEFVDAEEEEPKKKVNLEKSGKPKCKLIGEDGNIFNLIGIAARALRRAGLVDKADEMSNKVMHSGSYSEALSIIMEYVEVE